MSALNRYVLRSHLSEATFRRLVRLFSLELEATKTAALLGLSRRTVNRYYTLVRQRVAAACEACSPLHGTVEVDESYFGPRRVRGKRGRGASRKTLVFGLLKRDGQVYTQIVPNAKRATLRAILHARVDQRRSVIHSDGWSGYDGLVALGYQKHFRINHDASVFVRRRVHINGIEAFWGSAKTRLARRRGLRPAYFYLHLKECEFRFNHRRDNLYQTLLKMLRQDPLK